MAHDALGAHARDRARHLRDVQCASDSGCVGFSRQLRRRSSHALLGTAIVSDPGLIQSSRELAGFPRRPGRLGCAGGRRKRDDRSDARHVLGRAGDGADGRRRSPFRNSGVTRQMQRKASIGRTRIDHI